MTPVCLSCISKKDLISVIIMDKGELAKRSVEIIRDESIATSTYQSIIYAFKKGFSLLKLYIEDHPEVDSVVFECNNSAFINWVNQGYPREEYLDEFIEMMGILDNIPIRYSFAYTKKPKATMFAEKKYIVREKFSGLDIDGIEE